MSENQNKETKPKYEDWFYSLVGENIAKHRKAKNLTQEKFASSLGISRVSLINIESGKQRTPVHLLTGIASVLSIQISDIVPYKSAYYTDDSISKIIDIMGERDLIGALQRTYPKANIPSIKAKPEINIQERIEAFKNELKGLINKYNFGIKESDQYNGMDEFCGTERHFIVDGEVYHGETIEEIFKESVK